MRPRRASRPVAFAAAAAALAPSAAHACAICSALGAEGNRAAFIHTTVIMSLLPLAMIGAGLFWLVRHGRGAARAEFRESDEAAESVDTSADSTRG